MTLVSLRVYHADCRLCPTGYDASAKRLPRSARASRISFDPGTSLSPLSRIACKASQCSRNELNRSMFFHSLSSSPRTSSANTESRSSRPPWEPPARLHGVWRSTACRSQCSRRRPRRRQLPCLPAPIAQACTESPRENQLPWRPPQRFLAQMTGVAETRSEGSTAAPWSDLP